MHVFSPRCLLAASVLALGAWSAACGPATPEPAGAPAPNGGPAPIATVDTPPAAPGGPPGEAGEPDNTTDAPFTTASKASVDTLVANNTAFAIEVWKRASGTTGNVAMSPASLSIALGMTYGGADGETAAEMKKALHLTLPGAEVHNAFGTLLRAWEPEPKQPYELAVANRLFGERTLPFQKPFLALTGDHYGAELEPVDFAGSPESARRHINGWIADQTKKRIENLLPEGSLSSDTRLVLTNAVYFKGKWKKEFDDKQTKGKPFHAPSGPKNVPTMQRSDRYLYSETSDAQLLEMPYEGDDLAMQILLPTKRDGLPALEKALTVEMLEKMNQTSYHQVNVSLPRFVIDPPKPMALKPELKKLGMERAFSAEAQFPHIAEMPPGEGLAVSDVFHKAFVEVNEEGTEAAAATGVVMLRTTSVQKPIPPKDFVADHPFLFLIRDKRNGTILFLGRVSAP